MINEKELCSTTQSLFYVRAPAKDAIRAKKTKYVMLTTIQAVTFASVSKVSVLTFFFFAAILRRKQRLEASV